ncbi:hypothetical protein FQZ97_1214670 [compost metagenome]
MQQPVPLQHGDRRLALQITGGQSLQQLVERGLGALPEALPDGRLSARIAGTLEPGGLDLLVQQASGFAGNFEQGLHLPGEDPLHIILERMHG